MRRESVRSSAIASVGYDATIAVLEIEFTSGEVYRYFAVPPSVHRAMMDAPSVGGFFAERVRDVYPEQHLAV
jgi:hypothetical protein